MIVRFTRGNRRPDTLACLRDDGTFTFAPSHVGVPHDLIRYAIETTLAYPEAFYGLIAAGRAIDDFGTRAGRKDCYPAQSLQAELIVGLLQWPDLSGAPGLSYADFAEQLAAGLRRTRLTNPSNRRRPMWEAIRGCMHTLFTRWASVAPDGVLELGFPA